MKKIDCINKILDGSPNRMREKYFIKYHTQIYDEIIKFTRDVNDIPFKFKVWHWVNDEPNYILCKCGKKVKSHISWQDGWRKFCSTKCSANDLDKKEKSKNTILNKYGVEHYSQTQDFKTKVKETSLEKWGVNNFSKTKEFLEKSKKTYRNKWGVDNFTQTEEYRKKSKQTLTNKYGVDSWMKTENGKSRFKQKMIERYQVEQISQNEEYRKNNFDIAKNPFYIKYISEEITEFNCDNGLDHTFKISTDNYFGRKSSGNKLCTVCFPIASLTSIKEQMFYDYISSIYKSEIIRNHKDKYELDIFLPSEGIGFEFNGIWWHSDKYKEKDYHLKKTLYFENIGIRVIHIWEDDWLHKTEIVKSQITNILNLTPNKLWARRCVVKELSQKESQIFLNENHIQGNVSSNVKIGLFYNSDLVCVMTFDKYEGRKKMSENEWNLNRFCNKLGLLVVGGASKLLQFFIRKYNPNRIISYADRDWSTGVMYTKIGFLLTGIGSPDYKYLVEGRRVHKSRFRKSRLGYTIKESDWVKSKGISKVWDCGKLKFEIQF